MADQETALIDAIQSRDALQRDLDAAALEVSRALWNLHTGETSHAKLAGMLGVSRQRVGQLIARAERELRESLELEHAQAAYERRTVRQSIAERNRGFRTGGYPCAVKTCGRFKSRPSSVCDHCGDDPVSFNGDRGAYDREHGYA